MCWGERSFTDYVPPQGRFKAVATGEIHACALRDDGSAVCWGNDAYGQIAAPEGTFKDIAAGKFHTCGLRFDGSVACWGRSDSGQLEVPAGEYFKALAVGGDQACGVRLDGRMNCWGSQPNAVGAFGPFSTVSTQSFPFAFLTQIAAYLGTGLVGYGKGTDQKWDKAEAKAEAKAIKVQIPLLAAGLVLSALQSFLPKPPDPVAEALKRVEADLQELKVAVARIEAELKNIDTALKRIERELTDTACSISLQELRNTGVKVQTAQQEYAKLLDLSQSVLKAYAARADKPETVVPDITPNVQRFIDNYEKDLRQALNSIQESLIPSLSNTTGPLEKCMVKSYEQWKERSETPFDDRGYYQSIYEILGYALSYQGMALEMLQDIDVWYAQNQISKGKIEYSPGDTVGYCATVREKAGSGDPDSAVWAAAKIHCDDATNLTSRTYKNMVAQIERAGAPYSSDEIVLSLGLRDWGKRPPDNKPWANKQWLWVRDVDAYGDTRGGFADPLPSPTNPDRTKEFFTYPWVADPQSWQFLALEFLFVMKDDERRDLPMLMHEKAGFQHITDRPFWMGNTFPVKWAGLRGHAGFVSGNCRPGPNSVQMNCFIASGIGNDQLPGKQLKGMVCSEQEVQNIMRWRSNYVQQNSASILEDLNNGYRQHLPYLKPFHLIFSKTSSGCEGPDISSSPTFWELDNPKPRPVSLPRWPVLDISKLKCGKSMTDSGQDRPRFNYVGLPVRCGDDLDRFLNDLVPRPDSVAPSVALPDSVKEVTLTYQPDGDLEVCHIAENNPDWVAVDGYSWVVADLAQNRSGALGQHTDGAEQPYRTRQELGELIDAVPTEAFQVQCGGTVIHIPTGTRYGVRSPWVAVEGP
ncbi:RCC1 domain-containing protein [Methylococcus mesophilus]|uniref:RCC1 domain-containing protein n=1 Tax=Methylococcus mesophilus TaxID=2993564 RepID=UPI00374227AD